MTERCDFSDLPVDGCAHCRGISDAPASLSDIGVRIDARFAGRCANCGKPYPEGAPIGHSPEAGGWVSTCCIDAAVVA